MSDTFGEGYNHHVPCGCFHNICCRQSLWCSARVSTQCPHTVFVLHCCACVQTRCSCSMSLLGSIGQLYVWNLLWMAMGVSVSMNSINIALLGISFPFVPILNLLTALALGPVACFGISLRSSRLSSTRTFCMTPSPFFCFGIWFRCCPGM